MVWSGDTQERGTLHEVAEGTLAVESGSPRHEFEVPVVYFYIPLLSKRIMAPNSQGCWEIFKELEFRAR